VALAIRENKTMNYLKKYIIIGVVFMAACTNVKKVQVLQDALSKSDSTYLIKKKPTIDSNLIVQNIVNQIVENKLKFSTMNARLKLDYESEKNADDYIVNISLIKDSAIYITIRGAMGVIGLKAIIDKDSVLLIFPLTRKQERRPLTYLQEVVKIPFTFQTIQDLMIGNPIFMDKATLTSYKKTADRLQIGLLGNLFKNLIVLNEDNTKVLHFKLDDVDISEHRTCDITYGQHQAVLNGQFPLSREIIIGGKSKLEIRMEIKEYSFNEPLKYTFAIPKPGKRR
jgi:hypothetical protein